MKKRLSFHFSISFIICQVFLCLGGLFSTPAQAVKKDVNNFYFESYDANYYVYKAEDGVSRMKVTETVVAVFPDYNQNKGICREIARVDRGRIVLPELNRSNIIVTRNGLKEPIYSIEKDNQAYKLCTGDETYIKGRQTFEFQYEFQNVVSEFAEENRAWQEIYWDTNGTESKQRFDGVSVTVRFEDPSVLTGMANCYVGQYQAIGKDKCSTIQLSDGFAFYAKNLRAGENLTYEIQLKAGSFTIKEPEKSYIAVIAALIAGAICLLVFFRYLSKFKKTAENRKYYKDLFIKPEYSPDKKHTLLEMASVYIGKTKDSSVALMLDMLVKKKIELKKGDKNWLGKYKWSIIVKDVDGLDEAEKTLLKIINGGSSFEKDAEIEIKRRTATTSLVSLGRKLRKIGPDQAKTSGLVDAKFAKSGSPSASAANAFAMAIVMTSILTSLVIPFVSILFIVKDELPEKIFLGDKYLVCLMPMTWVIIAEISITIIICCILGHYTKRVQHHTKKGLEASRYMDGLKLYIEMAEADRINFLQSVKGADTSEKGIVKIYEQLLPYAALFGLEKSWMGEFEKYCQVNEIETPEWSHIDSVVAFSTISSTLHSASTYASSSTHFQSSGGSGFSGGGGGGFSGGGGGGGGFSGR